MELPCSCAAPEFAANTPSSSASAIAATLGDQRALMVLLTVSAALPGGSFIQVLSSFSSDRGERGIWVWRARSCSFSLPFFFSFPFFLAFPFFFFLAFASSAFACSLAFSFFLSWAFSVSAAIQVLSSFSPACLESFSALCCFSSRADIRSIASS
jgi:hypothetical protein